MSQPSLYDQIGGEATIDRLVDDFYDRVLSDDELSPFFADTSMDKLRRMQKEFFSLALDGPPPASDIDLFQAHRDRGIERRHLTRFTDHLLATLRQVGVEEDCAIAIVDRIATYSNEILGDAYDSG